MQKTKTRVSAHSLRRFMRFYAESIGVELSKVQKRTQFYRGFLEFFFEKEYIMNFPVKLGAHPKYSKMGRQPFFYQSYCFKKIEAQRIRKEDPVKTPSILEEEGMAERFFEFMKNYNNVIEGTAFKINKINPKKELEEIISDLGELIPYFLKKYKGDGGRSKKNFVIGFASRQLKTKYKKETLRQLCSLSSEIGAGSTLEEVISDASSGHEIDFILLKNKVNSVINFFYSKDERNKRICKKYFFHEFTHYEIAHNECLTTQTVRRIIKKPKEELRQLLAA